MLGVYVDELLAQLLKKRKWHRSVVDEGTALAGGCKLTAHDACAFIVVDIVQAEEVSESVAAKVELGLYHALFCSLLDGLRVSALSKQQANGSEDDALAGSRLAGNDGESRVKLKVEGIY